MKKCFTDGQIISILREAEAGISARELCRKARHFLHHLLHLTQEVWRYGGAVKSLKSFSLITSVCTAFIISAGWA